MPRIFEAARKRRRGMNELIRNHRAEIESLCRCYDVARLDVFGSATKGGFDASHSDVDFVVEFQRSTRWSPADQYFGLLEELEKLLGCRVDLVCDRAMRNKYFIQSVNATRRPLYAA